MALVRINGSGSANSVEHKWHAYTCLTDAVANVASATVDVIPIGSFERGGFSGTTTATAVSFWVCDSPTGTFVKLYSEAAVAVSFTGIASTVAYAIPAACFSWPYLKITSEAGASTIRVVLKT